MVAVASVGWPAEILSLMVGRVHAFIKAQRVIKRRQTPTICTDRFPNTSRSFDFFTDANVCDRYDGEQTLGLGILVDYE